MIRRLLNLFGKRRVHSEPAPRVSIGDALDQSLANGFYSVNWENVQYEK